MKITVTSILNETPFILGIWAARFNVCRGIINNFTMQPIQDVIDFKGKRDVTDYNEGGYGDKVNIVWGDYCGEDFDSAHWGEENLIFTSDFIMQAAERYKKCRLELKTKKIIELKNEVAKLQADILQGKAD